MTTPAYTKLTFLQSETLANWLRDNYTQRHLTDAEAAELANLELEGMPEINYNHVSYLREEIGIPKNYARKPRTAPARSVEERISDLEEQVAQLRGQLQLLGLRSAA